MRLLYPAGPSVATEQTTEQPPDYRASPDFFVGPIGLFEIWRSAINYEAVCRTAPATPGLLIIQIQVLINHASCTISFELV